MKRKVYVDGQEGTTGLRINERLQEREDIELIRMDPLLRKDPAQRRRLLNEADVAILCLPDEASREAVGMIENPNTRVLDTSTAFRTADGWAYGFPELGPQQREKIKASRRVAVPGCHATGFISIVFPLVAGSFLRRDIPLSCHSISGYTGGGKKLIADYERFHAENPGGWSSPLDSTRYYALSLNHKHLPEMQKVCGLAMPPLFTPCVGNFSEGMLVTVPLNRKSLQKRLDAAGIREYYGQFYRGERFIRVVPSDSPPDLDHGYLDATGCNGTNRLDLFVFGHDDQIFIVARLDNLGKGASGAAVQCMNLLLGLNEAQGLE